MTTEINDLVADARRRLRAAGIPPDEAALDARLLAQHVLGWDAARLSDSRRSKRPPAGFDDAYEALVARRARASRSPTSPAARNSGAWTSRSRRRCSSRGRKPS